MTEVERMEDTKVNGVESRFARLVNRFLDGGVVPFIGAGVSLAATCTSDGKCIACTKYMGDNIQAAIAKGCKNHRDMVTELPTKRFGPPLLATLAEKYVWMQSLEGCNHPYTLLVYEVLRIHEFTELCLLPAHRYIAFLAREGCIEEIITSNYDTCLSEAFRQSFYSTYSDAIVAEIADLDAYRAHAGRRRHEGNGPMLKIYHINGCAKCLLRDEDPEYKEEQSKTILLTEAQLQDWRQRHWGREMLKDRLRTRSILFSGFGSSEPQVRHTVMQVIEEFGLQSQEELEQNESGQKLGNMNSLWEHFNAPFIHAYEEKPTFEQKQILFQFAAKHNNGKLSDELISESNCFTGKDIGFFLNRVVPQAANEQNRLPADMFWQCVYTAVFWRLLEEEFRLGSAFWYFIDSLVPCADALMKEMRSWLFPNESSGAEHFFGRFPELLTLDQKKNLTKLSRHMWHMRYRRDEVQVGWYAALSDKCMLIPSYFLILYLLCGTEPDAPDAQWEDIEKHVVLGTEIGLGFRFNRCNGADNDFESGLLVCFAHEESRFKDSEKINCPEDVRGINSVVQIIVGHSVKAKRSGLWFIHDRGASKTHRYVPCYQVPFSDLFRDDVPYSSSYRMLTPEDVAHVFKRNILAAGSIVDSYRDRIPAVASGY